MISSNLIFFSGPLMAQIWRVNIWQVSHILDIISRSTSPARWNYSARHEYWLTTTTLMFFAYPSMYPSYISLAVMCLSPWHDITYDLKSKGIILCDIVSRGDYMPYFHAPPLIQLACFLPCAYCTTARELIRWNQRYFDIAGLWFNN